MFHILNKSYAFQLALQVSEVLVESPVVRQQLGVLSIFTAQSCLHLPQLGQRIGQIILLFLAPEEKGQNSLFLMPNSVQM